MKSDHLLNDRFLSRRNLLKHTALMTVLAPVLRKRDAYAAASPHRLILIFSPNGPMNALGPARGTETSFTVHDWWKPLERHKADATFMSHMAATGAGAVTGSGHGLGGQVYSAFGANSYAQKGPTIDQVIGKRLEAERRAGLKRSVVWGTSGRSSSGGTGDAFAVAAGRNIAPELDPSKAWAELFASFMAPAPTTPASMDQAAALIARRQSILDFVNEDCKSLKDMLGAEGMRLLDDHCTTLRGLEKSLVTGIDSAAAGMCRKPANPGEKAWSNPENIDSQMAAFIDLMATTLACELSHLIAFQFGGQSARNRLAAKYGVPSSPRADSGDSGPAHHPWTHQRTSDSKVKALSIFTTFYASQVALLVDKLKTTVDANGKPLLDSTMVLWVSELGGKDGGSDYHQVGTVPAILFGRGQGTFKTGRYYRGKSGEGSSASGASFREGGREMAQLMVSMIQYMGLKDVKTVGSTGVSGPLTSLYA
jgi:hypothetical protein